jgi:hypothetical protein
LPARLALVTLFAGLGPPPRRASGDEDEGSLSRSRPLVVSGTMTISAPATAQPIDKGHFDDVFTTDVYDCDGTPDQDAVDMHGNFNFNLRGSSPFPYFRESVQGTIITTNLLTGGTYTQVTSNNKDRVITDGGDGTLTIVGQGAGGFRAYDQFGKAVLKDPGNVRYASDIDYNGTPGNPADDTEVPDSFRIVRDSTGLNDTEGRDFCEDLVLFTSRSNRAGLTHSGAPSNPVQGRSERDRRVGPSAVSGPVRWHTIDLIVRAPTTT